MKEVFADTFFWIALANPLDQWHAKAKDARRTNANARIITTDEVLVEFLNFFAERGAALRTTAVKLARSIRSNPNVTVMPQTRDSFTRGFQLYEARADKGYSMTDCISMETMRDRNLTEILTHDNHFAQEGFALLIS